MRALWLLVVFTLACSGKKEEEKPAPKEPVGSGSATQAAPVTTGVQLYVDDAAVGKVEPAQVASWPRLDSLLPEEARRLGKWAAIATKGAKPAELAKPFETYRDYVPALFPGEGGKISFGLFDPVEYGKRGKPALREDAITELRVTMDKSGARGENDHGGGEVIDPATLELVIKTKAGESKLTGVQLLAIPREGMPGGGGDAKGWKLGTILDAAGVKAFKKVRLSDAAGGSVPLEQADLGGDAVPFLKLNRQGSLRFRLYKKQGDGWQSAGDLRSVTKIEILE